MPTPYTLTVPNTPTAPVIVEGFVERLAHVSGLEGEAVVRLTLAVRLAVEHVVCYGHLENERDELVARCNLSDDGFDFSLRDHGLPDLPLEKPSSDAAGNALIEKLREALGRLDGHAWAPCGYGSSLLRRYAARRRLGCRNC